MEVLTQRLDGLSERLAVTTRGSLERRGQTVTSLGARLRHPLQQVHDMRRHLENQGRALDAGFRRTVDAAHGRLQRWGDLLESYSYRGVLKRGFALVTDATGHAIGSAGEAKPGEGIAIEFHDGKVAATVDGAPAKPKPAKPPEPKAGSQGQLF
jgi:exodeoxyribonuclease VII large subunit